MQLKERFNTAKAKVDEVKLKIEELRQAFLARESKIKDINDTFKEIEKDIKNNLEKVLNATATKKKLDAILAVKDSIAYIRGVPKEKRLRELEQLSRKNPNFAKNAFLYLLLKRKLRVPKNLVTPNFLEEEEKDRIENLQKLIQKYKRLA